MDKMIFLQVPQVARDRFRIGAAHLFLKLGEPQRPIVEVPDDDQVPAAAEDLKQVIHVAFAAAFTIHDDLSISYFLATILLFYY
jgi:hypothetical protein